MAVQGQGVATMFAVQQADAFAFCDIWEIGPVIVFKGSGIAYRQLVFIRLPNQIAQRAPDGSNLAGSPVTHICYVGEANHRAVHDVAGKFVVSSA